MATFTELVLAVPPASDRLGSNPLMPAQGLAGRSSKLVVCTVFTIRVPRYKPSPRVQVLGRAVRLMAAKPPPIERLHQNGAQKAIREARYPVCLSDGSRHFAIAQHWRASGGRLLGVRAQTELRNANR